MIQGGGGGEGTIHLHAYQLFLPVLQKLKEFFMYIYNYVRVGYINL